jgi:CubicO group peptidase (beta-lactamase class C family)
VCAPHTGPRDLQILFSASKSITGLLAGALAGAGELSLDAEVTAYAPEVGHSGFDGRDSRPS